VNAPALGEIRLSREEPAGVRHDLGQADSRLYTGDGLAGAVEDAESR
jgi:hypothetical protein